MAPPISALRIWKNPWRFIKPCSKGNPWSKTALYNKRFDEELIKTEPASHFNQAYLEDFRRDTGPKQNNQVIFNFETEDLAAEYARLRALKIGELSDLMYVNVHMPYWYFNIKDPDGNLLEITGKYPPKP